ncbi:DNA oxidative demethylase ALKBH2 isoform X2 [Fukomys damarensis]|uniref:DNA oxidative demethylase ALKBH2 isoform X2 n=1 Tax=Fukomys damarensis TaxID=885580 RepID=UPI00053F90FD|nr:DNA oxidative demethylase ALKBH2 isoform X2 [Fukomys damarensis]
MNRLFIQDKTWARFFLCFPTDLHSLRRGRMERFLVKRAQGDLVGKGEQQKQTEEEPATLSKDPGGPRKRPRREIQERASPEAGASWRHIWAEGLDCDYTVLFGKAEADEIFQELEKKVEYFTGIKMAVTILGSTETMNENWPQEAPLPLSPLGPVGTSFSGIRIPGERTPARGWRSSGCSWPTEAC